MPSVAALRAMTGVPRGVVHVLGVPAMVGVRPVRRVRAMRCVGCFSRHMSSVIVLR
jgi:hypothetical protein